MTVTLRSRMSVTVSRQESPRNVVSTMYKRSAEVENLQFFASCIARNYQRILFYRAEISQAEIPYSTAGGAAVGNSLPPSVRKKRETNTGNSGSVHDTGSTPRRTVGQSDEVCFIIKELLIEMR